MTNGKIPYVLVRGATAEQGFRGVTSPPRFAMLFEGNGPMVMNGVGVALDAAFIDDKKAILQVITMLAEPPASFHPKHPPLTTYQGPMDTRYVLEAPAGWFATNEWGVGDVLTFREGVVTCNTQSIPLSGDTPKHAFRNKVKSLGAEVLTLDAMRYLLGPCSLRWGQENVLKALHNLRIVKQTLEDTDILQETGTVEDIYRYRDFHLVPAHFEMFGGVTPTLFVQVGSERDETALLMALFKGIHTLAMGKDWMPEETPKSIRKTLLDLGFTPENILTLMPSAIDALHYCRIDNLLRLMEMMLFFDFKGMPVRERNHWLWATAPDMVQKEAPFYVDYVREQYHLSPSELVKAKWPLKLPASLHHETLKVKTANSLFSVISVPKAGLDPVLWDFHSHDSDEPILKEEVANTLLAKLYQGLKDNGYAAPEKWCARILLLGSSTGNQYEEDSDLDVTIVVDFDAYRKYEGSRDSLSDTIKEHRKTAQAEAGYYRDILTLGTEEIHGYAQTTLLPSVYLLMAEAIAQAGTSTNPDTVYHGLAPLREKTDHALTCGHTHVLSLPPVIEEQARVLGTAYGLPPHLTDKIAGMVRNHARYCLEVLFNDQQ